MQLRGQGDAFAAAALCERCARLRQGKLMQREKGKLERGRGHSEVWFGGCAGAVVWALVVVRAV